MNCVHPIPRTGHRKHGNAGKHCRFPSRSLARQDSTLHGGVCNGTRLLFSAQRGGGSRGPPCPSLAHSVSKFLQGENVGGKARHLSGNQVGQV